MEEKRQYKPYVTMLSEGKQAGMLPADLLLLETLLDIRELLLEQRTISNQIMARETTTHPQ